MNILAIDTSNQVLGVSILKGDQIIGEVMTNLTKNHSVRLMPAIEKLMKEVSMRPEELDKIIVAKGPGSYTGVRIGVSTAKTMAWALDIPVVGVSSLEVLSYQGRFFDGVICPFFDARRGLVFTGLYQWRNSHLEAVFEEKNLLMEDVLQTLKEQETNVLFLSPDIAIYKEAIEKGLGERAIIPEGPYHIPKAGHLGLAGLTKQPDTTHALTPNYLRLAEAEANWLKAQKENEHHG
ncbi:tRNA (adenosine(37)-N6)-threonylcarbamoyltransferase complex dimerization subunit type 1 TsaB [Oceanobacillus profundus]|uniref:tRNA (adenosine(37)-N6)-threonylcarbamoyltransferase complex dimerization subunit type 1 TsaB n=1 Tax=Oceanobacillus TaxID=182709 RepID=UPI0026E13622|nr:tRNA (adenosine(37)-N6)-threonylcarbamoyltransferase complex dimerization subunit type 1 TsaB [Oceanobacillus profundus]MDO6451475.1 tRNA (adenosine(37)-N6)-threonylcarbamoyltransferase complex dimerization subunit type 1 TsaB [Oceanobacillus profundus]